jgi:hypothetical protein
MREIFAEAPDSLMMIAIGARPRGKINIGYVSEMRWARLREAVHPPSPTARRVALQIIIMF